ncbi:uncharacterized protein LOC119091902 isoform X2 [Pollicipes pollicipes]|nr:uncharacterized protein LOC119091902 isoform X2 [Pollicipes pollicipes]
MIDAANHSLKEEFSSLDEFQAWKDQYEADTGAVYNVASSRPRSGTTARYLCSRSGVYAPAGTGKRRLKSQGTCKLGCRCTSDVMATTREDGTVLVTVHPFHYGHSMGISNIPHVRIPSLHKAAIKEKLLTGVSMSRIMKDVREAFGAEAAAGTSSSCPYWLQRRDLHNMCRSVGITAADGSAVKNRNEVISVQMFAEEIRSSDQQHLLAFKLPGEADSNGALRDEDFVFAFCSSFQLAKFVQHGAKVVCMDGTHATSGHDFHLITLLVVTETGAGMPVAWLISSREDEPAISSMLTGLVRTCEELELPFPTVRFLMTDKAMAFYNAWLASTCQHDTQHILCAWHVLKAWKGKLAMVTRYQRVCKAVWPGKDETNSGP